MPAMSSTMGKKIAGGGNNGGLAGQDEVVGNKKIVPPAATAGGTTSSTTAVNEDELFLRDEVFGVGSVGINNMYNNMWMDIAKKWPVKIVASNLDRARMTLCPYKKLTSPSTTSSSSSTSTQEEGAAETRFKYTPPSELLDHFVLGDISLVFHLFN